MEAEIHNEENKRPIIEIDGKKYEAVDPFVKTIAKDGEITIGGFWEVQDENS